MRRIFVLLLFTVLLFVSVSCEPDTSSTTDTGTETATTSDSVKVESSSDYEWDSTAVTYITFSGTSITATSADVTISGTTASITAGGCYSVSGTLSDGQLIINAQGEIVKVELNGVGISCSSASPLFIQKAKKAIIFLAEGTSNSFTDASSYADIDLSNACIYSKAYMAITGEGALIVNGKYQDGIAGADEMVINNGVITVTAVDDGIRGKDYLKINAGTIAATCSTGHALKSDNSESTELGFIQVEGGTITLASTSGKGIKALNKYIQNEGYITVSKAYEGIESENIAINGGTLAINATNDGVNATAGTVSGGTESNDGSTVKVTGGILIANASKGDALDSNGTFSISGGIVIANGPSSGDGDGADINGTFTLSGGTLVIAGKSLSIGGMNSSSISGTQPYIKLSGSISSSTLADLSISSTDIITFQPKYGGSLFILSSPDMAKGDAYTIYTGGSYSEAANSGGYYSNGTYTAGTSRKTGTLSSTSTSNSVSLN